MTLSQRTSDKKKSRHLYFYTKWQGDRNAPRPIPTGANFSAAMFFFFFLAAFCVRLNFVLFKVFFVVSIFAEERKIIRTGLGLTEKSGLQAGGIDGKMERIVV